VFPASADVIVALGGGIARDGVPLSATAVRARRAAALYRSGRACPIVMSGAHGMFDPPPLRAEAMAMAQVAVAAGVAEEDIAVEARSRDTIGNIWFTKPLLAERGWHRVIVVTSGWHAPRVRNLTQTIWGPSYSVAIEPVTGEQSTRPTEEIVVWEAGLLAVSRRWFAAIRPGDDAAIAAVLAREHPIYASHPRTTLAELAQMVTRHRRATAEPGPATGSRRPGIIAPAGRHGGTTA
jgi:uncharacterized SAM-binding protein YcdF (DUF218 family)